MSRSGIIFFCESIFQTAQRTKSRNLNHIFFSVGRYRSLEPATDGGCYRYTLLISGAGVSDARIYVLRVENERGSSSHAVSLTVHGKNLHLFPNKYFKPLR